MAYHYWRQLKIVRLPVSSGPDSYEKSMLNFMLFNKDFLVTGRLLPVRKKPCLNIRAK